MRSAQVAAAPGSGHGRAQGAPGLQADRLLRLAADRGEGRVSLFLPGRRAGQSFPDDRIRFTGLVRRVGNTLRQDGFSASEAEAVLGGAWDLVDDLWLWETAGNGLAVFTSPESTRCFWVPAPLRELATIGDRFAVGPLLPLLNGTAPYLVLLLTGDETRLFRGTRFEVEEILASSLLFDDGMSLRLHFRRLDAVVREVAGEEKMPLVVLGARHLQRLYREVNTYPDLVLPDGTGDVSLDEVHRRSWTVVEPVLLADEHAAVAECEAGGGRVITEPAEVLAAARDGRVGTLFVSAEAARYAGMSVVVRLSEAGAADELVDQAVVAVLAGCGSVITLPVLRMPGRGPLAATLRA
ncbi:hypothetical protein SAMN05216553_101505 [Lentzea fradiae]|uniref:Uncharacterized protein n=1 Tax=Lentzea fradiae TaxID=200378 RepID=A0A1G7KV79_9PSEU|nr:hypothetical protein [Lentzea fradiae]SDF41133.1 hypothetical protein SAMN05216553_101505 [Lentzea fradiae]